MEPQYPSRPSINEMSSSSSFTGIHVANTIDTQASCSQKLISLVFKVETVWKFGIGEQSKMLLRIQSLNLGKSFATRGIMVLVR